VQQSIKTREKAGLQARFQIPFKGTLYLSPLGKSLQFALLELRVSPKANKVPGLIPIVWWDTHQPGKNLPMWTMFFWWVPRNFHPKQKVK